MKLTRFRHGAFEFNGAIRGEEIAVIEGEFWEDFRVTDAVYPLKQVKLLPVSIPSKIVCIGLNYLKHIEEVGATQLAAAHFFLKPPTCLIGPEDAIVIPKHAERVDYEGELAMVIGKPMKDVPEKDALSYVLGYTCFNDVTERALVGKSMSYLTEAKGYDTFGAVGPWMETDLDPDSLDIKTFLNGKIMQEDNTADCLFSASQVLFAISRCMTLLPGDIVSTGTPKGIAPMKAGDIVEVEIAGIGKLRNHVRSA
jgi:2-keto-4-pentenoate hydratase/2-oxohepta-3-ene-1,7-dioic acid hydratase in catechol pathway